MSIDELAKKAYRRTTEFISKEKKYAIAASAATAGVLFDYFTTHMCYQVGGYETNPITRTLMEKISPEIGLTLKTALTIGISLPLSYALNKIMRKNHQIDFGTIYLYVLSGISAAAAINNLFVYSICK